MSDERFDQDLRSVLMDDAPRDLPDALRRRVAAIPATQMIATRPFRPIWRVPVSGALRLAGLAALVALLAVGFWRFGPASQPGVGGEPSGSPSAAPSASALVSACRATDLHGQILGWGGAAGSRIADVEVTNATSRPCLMQGTPGLELVDAGGRVMIDSMTAGSAGQPHVAPADPKFELAPGGRLRTQVAASNYCGAAPATPIDIAFTLPADGGRLLAVPGPGVSSAEATPPCLGSTGAQIAMNGWRR